MRIGFTGSRKGMTIRQGWALSDWFHYPRDGGAPRVPAELHHGCCVGADSEFVTHMIRSRVGGTAERLYAEIHAHPSNLAGMTDEDALALSDVKHESKDPLVRNRDIVDACDVLLACPAEAAEQQRGGTWSTVRYGRRVGKPVVLILPDGTVTDDVERLRGEGGAT